MKEKNKFMLVKCNELPIVIETDQELETLQKLVGGFIECVDLDTDTLIICNEEGKIIGLPPNRKIGNDIIMGDFLIVGADDKNERFKSLTNEQIDKYMKEYGENSIIVENEKEPFEYYETNEIIKILKSKERLVYVDDGCDELVIKYKDIPDFIVDVNRKIGSIDLSVYDYHNPSLNPLITTYGEFLNKCDSKVREDIINRLVKLQTCEIEPKKYKVMDEYTILQAKEEIKREKKAKGKER